MFIGKKNNSIVVFNGSQNDLIANAAIKGITLDSIEQTDEQIVPSHNTQNDGIYYKLSEVPEEPLHSFNAKQRVRRQERYAALSDPITSHIAVIRDRIANGEYSSADEKTSWEGTITDLLLQRRGIRSQIANDFPYKEEN
ncbi:MAG: hypothetical protein LBS22_04305 [Puniceicoccales bacterium]|jgi:hypothetical protein|nr:hypothetical protein [Puniceicoccales bacterium]